MSRETAEPADGDIPEVGLGTWRMVGETAYETVRTALRLGYRHVDTARTHDNEREIGRATTSVDMTFHDGVNERHIIESEVVDLGSTLATSRVRVYPESELETEDPDLIASGDTTARMFEDLD